MRLLLLPCLAAELSSQAPGTATDDHHGTITTAAVVELDPASFLPPPPEPGGRQAQAELAELHAVEAGRTAADVASARSDGELKDASIFTEAIGPAFVLARLPASGRLMAAVRSAKKAAVDRGKLREAWHSEPCTGGFRLGFLLSAVAQAPPEETIWHPGGIVLKRGEDMMTSKARERLEGLTFPITVHRGGVGDATLVVLGVSWTTDIAVARYYAHAWPRRGGFRVLGRTLSMRIERHEAVAFFTDRSEAELLVPEGVPRDREFEVAKEGQEPRPFRFVIREPEPGSLRRLYVEPVPD